MGFGFCFWILVRNFAIWVIRYSIHKYLGYLNICYFGLVWSSRDPKLPTPALNHSPVVVVSWFAVGNYEKRRQLRVRVFLDEVADVVQRGVGISALFHLRLDRFQKSSNCLISSF